MAKKRNCERTEEERAKHKRAVSIKKMTNEQLLAYFDQEYARGFEDGKKASSLQTPPNIAKNNFLKDVENIKGIGTGTMSKIRALLAN